MPRTGKDYIESLKDDRHVLVNGERVSDVTNHPAFSGTVNSLATLYDFAASPENRDLMTFTSPTTGKPVHRAFQIPRNQTDLRLRREALTAWADLSYGLMGRSPDHVAGFLTG